MAQTGGQSQQTEAISSSDLVSALMEWSHLQAMTPLSIALRQLVTGHNTTDPDDTCDTGETNHVPEQTRLRAVLMLCRNLHVQLRSAEEELRKSDHGLQSEHSLNECIKWSYKELNVVIAAMASMCRHDPPLLLRPASDSFLLVDIFYKLKQLKVLSFLAISPQLPIELLATIISETFMWTAPTQASTHAMQVHSRLVAHYSNCVHDHNSLHSYLTHNLLFELKECLNFVAVHFHSFVDLLSVAIGSSASKTQIELILDNWSPTPESLLSDMPNSFESFLERLVSNRSLLYDQDLLIRLFNDCFIS